MSNVDNSFVDWVPAVVATGIDCMYKVDATTRGKTFCDPNAHVECRTKGLDMKIDGLEAKSKECGMVRAKTKETQRPKEERKKKRQKEKMCTRTAELRCYLILGPGKDIYVGKGVPTYIRTLLR